MEDWDIPWRWIEAEMLSRFGVWNETRDVHDLNNRYINSIEFEFIRSGLNFVYLSYFFHKGCDGEKMITL